MVFPPGRRWDIDLGKKNNLFVFCNFIVFFFIIFGKCMRITKTKLKFIFVDVGMRRPHGISRKKRRGKTGALVPVQNADATQDLVDVEESLERLLGDIHDVDIDDLPRGLQRYVFGVPARFRQFLRKLASLVAIYHEHRP